MTELATPSDPSGDHGRTLTSDAELLHRIRAGHTESWDVLIDRYQGLVYSVALRSGLDPEDAVDVAQTAFLTLLESQDSLRDEERLVGWLVTITRRQAWRVRERRHRERPAAQPLALEPDEPLDSGGLLEWEQLTVLHTAVEQLGSPCRELIRALYFDARQPTYTQIARTLGRSVGGIGPLRGRCLATLRQTMEEAS
ncbi:RNA polymerase sigma factor [Nocardioides dokdonensis FR1436]|uniref:RNA polymerase sigma factor n=1 Tax=Nocardioides dokdonensis FR1436 TaxID=1300347 RepID=A0A1A9GP44_9ACTN|nr:sigma-70 family RNA polymerase sigma factor [Nocardioides dokdonensis]ANH39856.1 RNA polymerase sigma factor [Nocardioides dokdonensis FR1436]